jgi:hypothetical protein
MRILGLGVFTSQKLHQQKNTGIHAGGQEVKKNEPDLCGAIGVTANPENFY